MLYMGCSQVAYALQVDAIREYWSFCGEIEDLDVMRFPDTGRFKGIAFITYTTVSSHLCLTQALHVHSSPYLAVGIPQLTSLVGRGYLFLLVGEQHASMQVFGVYTLQAWGEPV